MKKENTVEVKKKWGIIFPGLICLLLVVSCLACAIGPASISPINIFKIFLNRLPFFEIAKTWSSEEELIILKVRLPRILTAGLIGGALTLAGLSFQALLRNPLADPYILGVSGGASLGSILAIWLGLGTIFGIPTLPLFAFGGALLTMLLVYNIAHVEGRVPTHTLLLAGVIVNLFFSAVIMYLVSIIGVMEARSFQFWTMGDLSSSSKRLTWIVAGFIFISGTILYCYARNFNLMLLGEESAAYLGVEVEKFKLIVFILASLVTGAAVSASGMIGFVGLIIPHISRMLLGANHRTLIPASFLIGAIFLIIADTIARTIVTPVGVVTAMCGGPYFIYLLRKRKSSFF